MLMYLPNLAGENARNNNSKNDKRCLWDRNLEYETKHAQFDNENHFKRNKNSLSKVIKIYGMYLMNIMNWAT